MGIWIRSQDKRVLAPADAEVERLQKLERAARFVYNKECKPCIEKKCNTCAMCAFGEIKNALDGLGGDENASLKATTKWRDKGYYWECECCKYAFVLLDAQLPVLHEINFCPKCGRKIVEFVEGAQFDAE